MITQRLILDGPYPDGVWTCPGCMSPLTEGRLEHPDDCPEMRRGNAAGPLTSPAQVHVWLGDHGWAMIGTGEGGSAWQPPDGIREVWVGVPDGGTAPELAGALERIAKRSGLPFGEVLAGMRSICLPAGEETDD